MAKLTVPDYTGDGRIKQSLVIAGSPLNEFPFTDSLSFDAKFEAADQNDVITGGLLRTSRGPNRAQLANVNELGAPQEGLYIYVKNVIRTSFTEDTIFFYDLSGILSAAIQMPIPGVLSLSATTINLIGDVNITGALNFTGTLDVTGSIEATADIIADQRLVAGLALLIADGVTPPATVPSYAQIYVDVADGDLKVKFGDGTVKTIVTD